MGEMLEISISIKSEQVVRGVGIAVEDSVGRRLFVVSPDYTHPGLLGNSTTCAKLICSLPMPLLPGLYYLTIGVTGFTGALDRINKAANITVAERDVFKTGGSSGKIKGVFFTHADWHIERND